VELPAKREVVASGVEQTVVVLERALRKGLHADEHADALLERVDEREHPP